MLPCNVRNQLFMERAYLIDRTMKRHSSMIDACHLCREDVRQELALRLLLLLERYDPSRSSNLDAYLSLYLRYAMWEMGLPSHRYGIPQAPVGRRFQVISLNDIYPEPVSSNLYDVVELWDAIDSLPSAQQAAVCRLLRGERLHCTNKQLQVSRKQIHPSTRKTHYQLKKECDPDAEAEI